MQSTIFKRTYIILLAILAILTSNMYVPGIPLIQTALHTNIHAIQMSVSYYMLGLAIGMLIYGPLADHFGRKPILYLGLIIYMGGLVLSATSTNIHTFLYSRLLQALGAAAALSLWQALAVDTYKKHAAKMIAVGYMAIGCIPALSPLVGSNIIHFIGWRSVFILLTAYGALLFMATYFFSTQHHTDHQQHFFKKTLQRYKSIICSKKFMLLAIFSSVIYSQLYVFIALTPSLLHTLHYTTQQIGLFFIPISVSFILGSFLTRLMLGRNRETNAPLIIGLVVYLFGIALQLIFQFSLAHFGGFELIIPFAIITIGSGLMLPVIVGRAMHDFFNMAGSAAALIGATQNVIAFLLSAAAALLSHLHVMGLTYSLSIMVLLASTLGILSLTTIKVNHENS